MTGNGAGAALLLGVATVSACSLGLRPPVITEIEGPDEGPGTFVYACERDFRFSARVEGDSARIRYGLESATLARSPARRDGVRFEGEGHVFEARGGIATIYTPAADYYDCEGRLAQSPWMESGLLGYDFRAVGQEPGWLVEIDDDGRTRVVTDYGETQFEVDTPDRVYETAEAVSYTVREPRSVRVYIEDEPCRDTMSGEELPSSVTLTLNGNEYRGCGREIDGRPHSELASVDWVLVDLDGIAGVATGYGMQAVIRFVTEAARVEGFTGCNNFVAPYFIGGGDIRFSQVIATTRLSCTGTDVERQERALVTAFRRTTRYEIVEGELVLYEGNRDLARFTSRRRP